MNTTSPVFQLAISDSKLCENLNPTSDSILSCSNESLNGTGVLRQDASDSFELHKSPHPNKIRKISTSIRSDSHSTPSLNDKKPREAYNEKDNLSPTKENDDWPKRSLITKSNSDNDSNLLKSGVRIVEINRIHEKSNVDFNTEHRAALELIAVTKVSAVLKEDKKDKRLERNRVAAKECREKKKAYIEELEIRMKDLRDQIDNLRKENIELKESLVLCICNRV